MTGLRAFVAIAAVLFAGAVSAQDNVGWAVSGTVENDFFDIDGDNTDRYYTQGFKLAAVSPARVEADLNGIQRGLIGLLEVSPQRRLRATVGVGQHIYTPEDLDATVPDPKDRPYAGWLYLSSGVIAYTDRELNAIELQVGVVGPSAHAGEAQNRWHEVIQAKRVMGWDHQLKDEIAINLYAERRWREEVKNGDNFDLVQIVSLAAGTVEVSAGIGAQARMGVGLDHDFGPARLRPGVSASEFFDTESLSAYVFGGVHGRVVARDVFLDGNTWVDSPSVKKRAFVPEATLGAAVRFGCFRFGYSYVWRGEEFVGQNGRSEFGAVNVTLSTRL